MKNMKAAVRTADGKHSVVESSYHTIKEFRGDLKRNGYTVIGRVSVEGEVRKSNLYNRGCK